MISAGIEFNNSLTFIRLELEVKFGDNSLRDNCHGVSLKSTTVIWRTQRNHIFQLYLKFERSTSVKQMLHLPIIKNE